MATAHSHQVRCHNMVPQHLVAAQRNTRLEVGAQTDTMESRRVPAITQLEADTRLSFWGKANSGAVAQATVVAVDSQRSSLRSGPPRSTYFA